MINSSNGKNRLDIEKLELGLSQISFTEDDIVFSYRLHLPDLVFDFRPEDETEENLNEFFDSITDKIYESCEELKKKFTKEKWDEECYYGYVGESVDIPEEFFE